MLPRCRRLAWAATALCRTQPCLQGQRTPRLGGQPSTRDCGLHAVAHACRPGGCGPVLVVSRRPRTTAASLEGPAPPHLSPQGCGQLLSEADRTRRQHRRPRKGVSTGTTSGRPCGSHVSVEGTAWSPSVGASWGALQPRITQRRNPHRRGSPPPQCSAQGSTRRVCGRTRALICHPVRGEHSRTGLPLGVRGHKNARRWS